MSDYISREAAMAVVEDEQKKLCPAGLWGRKFASDTDKYDAWQEILEELEAIPIADVEPVRRWIPCSERMPEICESTSYLAYIPSFGAVDIADYSPDVDEWAFMGMPITVTHWMPLPELPEEENDETIDG